MSLRQSLVQKNIQLLQQGAALVEELDDDLYVKSHGHLSSSGVGGHVRHLIDYYARFFEGLGSSAQGFVDYDRRERAEAIERQRMTAHAALLAFVAPLERLAGEATRPALRVRMEVPEAPPGEHAAATSSVERELSFLLSHTVHHFALIALLLRASGFDPGPELGVAPSTLAHWEETRSCAP